MVSKRDNKKQIVIAQHQRFMLRVLMQGLAREDRTLLTLNDGEEILRHVHAQPPDVLIIDVDMQPMSGKELCQRLQAELPDRQFLTCILTASAEDEYGRYAEWFGNFRMFEKPVSVGRIQRLIDDHLVERAA